MTKPYKIVTLKDAFPDYPGGAEAFLPEHGDFVNKPKDAFVIVVEADFISDMTGAFSHEDILGSLPDLPEGGVFNAILFKKDLHIPNACYLDYDMDHSPSLIVEGNLTAKTLNLAGGQTHIKGDCTLSDVLYGHYNHGSLTVDGTTTAPLIIASDYSMTFNGKVNAEHVMRDGSAFKMNEPTFNISALGFKLKFNLPKPTRKILDIDADHAQIEKILDALFLTHRGLDDENINTALNKGESLYFSPSQPRKLNTFLPEATVQKIKTYETAHQAGETIYSVDFTGCYLKEVPAEIRAYAQLESLILLNNQIDTLPDWVQHFTQLKHLNVSTNSALASLRLSAKQTAQLKTLNISETLITDFDITDGNTQMLQLLEFRFGHKCFEENDAIGHFAANFNWQRMPNLQHLHMDDIGWWWPWGADFAFYGCSQLTYLQLGYIVDGEMGNNLAKLQKLEFFGFMTGFQSDGNYEGLINFNTLKGLPNLQVFNMEQNGKMVNMTNIRALRAALPHIYICAPNFYNNLNLMSLDAPQASEMAKIYASVDLTRDDSIEADVPEDMPIQLKYKSWLSSYGAHQPSLKTVQNAFDETLASRQTISPHLFEEVITASLKYVRDCIYDIEDRQMRQPLFVVLSEMVEKLLPITPKPASWTHLLPYGTYQLWELVNASHIWFLLRRADATAEHLQQAKTLLAICRPIGQRKRSEEFEELHEIVLASIGKP